MESTLLRPAAALLPSARARRIGSGMLSLAAFPGHDVVVLGGRRVGAGHGGVRLAIPGMVGGSRGKAARSGSGVEGNGTFHDHDPMDEFLRMLEIKRQEFSALQISLAPEHLTAKQSRGQKVLKAIGTLSCALALEVTARLHPRTDNPLFTELLDICCIFARVGDSETFFGVSTTLVRGLDDLRRVVIDASQVIPPGDAKEAYGDPMDSGDDEMIALVIIVYKRVLADLRYILHTLALKEG